MLFTEILIPFGMFVLGFITHHYYRKLYVERARLTIETNEATWLWDRETDYDGDTYEVLILTLKFTIRNEGYAVSIVNAEIKISSLAESPFVPVLNQTLIDSAHQVVASYSYKRGSLNRPPEVPSDELQGEFEFDVSIGEVYTHGFVVPPPKEGKKLGTAY